MPGSSKPLNSADPTSNGWLRGSVLRAESALIHSSVRRQDSSYELKKR